MKTDDQRQLIRRLIQAAFAWHDGSPHAAPPNEPLRVGHAVSICLDLPTIMEAITTRATQLDGISATELSKVETSQVRAELFAMPTVKAFQANTPQERFCLEAERAHDA